MPTTKENLKEAFSGKRQDNQKNLANVKKICV
jgi:hypothetical protein